MLIVFEASEVGIFLKFRSINPGTLEVVLTLRKC